MSLEYILAAISVAIIIVDAFLIRKAGRELITGHSNGISIPMGWMAGSVIGAILGLYFGSFLNGLLWGFSIGTMFGLVMKVGSVIEDGIKGIERGKLGQQLPNHLTKRYFREKDKAIRTDPNDPTQYFLRGSSYSELGQYQQAIDDFNKALGLDSSDVDTLSCTYNARGIAYYSLGEYQRAVRDYSKAIELDPNDAVAYNNRSLAYRRLGQDVEADADETKAGSLDKQWC